MHNTPALGEQRRESRKLPPVKVSGLTPKIVRRGNRTCLFSNRAGLSESTMPAEARVTCGRHYRRTEWRSRARFSRLLRAGMLGCLARGGQIFCGWTPGWLTSPLRVPLCTSNAGSSTREVLRQGLFLVPQIKCPVDSVGPKRLGAAFQRLVDWRFVRAFLFPHLEPSPGVCLSLCPPRPFL